ncbi:glycosyltransferase family 4 protein [Roseobacter sp. HKCCA0434]|uniref:glycosyltransferase family 4 protein n=1 Tax=Roseobacter sp. HKCCA0434 TaxID=3079297 RepID=UPI002905C742|nr:glycosyltransferase family 4 protein [Roseobacter sp. HKCCA0434]
MSRRVLQVLYSGLGGHAAVALPLIEAGGMEDPWEHRLLFYGIEPVAQGYRDAAARLGVAYDYVPARQGRPWAGWPNLMRALRAARADAVILHSIKTILPARLALRSTPIVAVEHQANALKTPAEWGASLMAQRLADRVVTLSPDYRATLARRLGRAFRADRTALVPTGIDLAPFGSTDRPVDNDRAGAPFRIGMAGRFTPTKAQGVLVAALARLRAAHPGRDWRLSLPGDGPCHAAVRAAVAQAGLDAQVEMPGHLPSDALPGWFETLDLYAHSSDGETLSTALLQAMAAELPIVASDVAGISDLLGPPGAGQEPLGRLVPARDVDAFATAIAALAQDACGRIFLAGRARAHVLARHSPEAMRAGYDAVLKPVR